MLSDPQSVIINTSTIALPAISRGSDASLYRTMDTTWGEVKFTVSHQYKARNRVSARVDITKFVTSVTSNVLSVPVSASAYIVLDRLVDYTSDTDSAYLLKAVANWLLAGTNAAKIAAGET
jgi:hypothetical protein